MLLMRAMKGCSMYAAGGMPGREQRILHGALPALPLERFLYRDDIVLLARVAVERGTLTERWVLRERLAGTLA